LILCCICLGPCETSRIDHNARLPQTAHVCTDSATTLTLTLALTPTPNPTSTLTLTPTLTPTPTLTQHSPHLASLSLQTLQGLPCAFWISGVLNRIRTPNAHSTNGAGGGELRPNIFKTQQEISQGTQEIRSTREGHLGILC
jgi:hypothetical protein